MQEFKEKFLALIHSEQTLRKYSLRSEWTTPLFLRKSAAWYLTWLWLLQWWWMKASEAWIIRCSEWKAASESSKKPSLLSAKLCSAAVKQTRNYVTVPDKRSVRNGISRPKSISHPRTGFHRHRKTDTIQQTEKHRPLLKRQNTNHRKQDIQKIPVSDIQHLGEVRETVFQGKELLCNFLHYIRN